MMCAGNKRTNSALQNSAWDTLAFVEAMDFDSTTLLPRVSHLQWLSPAIQENVQVVPVSTIFHESLEMSIGKSFEPSPFPPHDQRQPEVVGSAACVSFDPGLLAVATEVINVMLNENRVNRTSESTQGWFSASVSDRNSGRHDHHECANDAEGTTEWPQRCSSAVVSNNSGTSDFHEGTRSRHELHWEFRYERLLAFKELTGHCLVPSNYHLDVELSRWVKRQRHQYKNLKKGERSTLTPYRFEKLQNVGFVWDVHELSWNENLEELRKFYRRHGHSNVPTSYPDNPKLPLWVKSQRREYKLFHIGQKSQLTPERIAALNALQFKWGRFHRSTSNLYT
eukprot:scaffold5707_cov112-Cylindrotheca_fusiformis.AAC.1